MAWPNGSTALTDIYQEFGATLRELYQQDTPIIALCAAGIVIRTLAPLLLEKGAEPPVLAVAEDGSAVVPLFGGLGGVNVLAREIAARAGRGGGDHHQWRAALRHLFAQSAKRLCTGLTWSSASALCPTCSAANGAHRR